MTKTTTIHIEPLDEGFVVTQDGKRKATTFEQIKEWAMSDLLEMLMKVREKKTDSWITLTLDTDIPRTV